MSQAWGGLKELVAIHNAPIVLCHEYVWFGADFAAAAGALIAELDRTFPKWGACGNRGCNWEGSTGYDYTCFTQNEGGGLETAVRPKLVLTIDDNLVLLNCAELRRLDLVDLRLTVSNIFGLPLSLECLKSSLPLLVDPRLFTVRTEQHSSREIQSFMASPEFGSYYRSNFLDYSIPWPDGPVNAGGCVDYSSLPRPDLYAPQSDLLKLFDKTVEKAFARRTSLTICCRTQFGRPELLHRAVTSFAIAEIESRGLLEVSIRLVTDQEIGRSESFTAAYREEFPTAGIKCWHHTVRPPRYSRTDLILTAIERAETDYILFVDDDDYLLPGAMQALARTIWPADDTVIIGNSVKVEETWAVPPQETLAVLTASRMAGRFSAHNLFRVFAGANHIPVCSVLLPAARTRSLLAGRKALGDYNEDYFVLLTALTAPGADVRLLDADLCGVSFRGSLNTVTAIDRSRWHLSYATFMQELLCGPDRNPMTWQIGKRLPV